MTFTSAWVGIAGYDRPSLQAQIDKALCALLRLPLGSGLVVTTDIDLLPSAIASNPDIDSAIVLVAGTGSIAMRYERHKGNFIRTGRAGGWGYLLGDDGSGYSLGREGARLALMASDIHRSSNPKSKDLSSFSPLATAILKHVQHHNPACRPDDVLSGILCMRAAHEDDPSTELSPAKKIALLAEVVLSQAPTDAEANSIVDAGAKSLIQLVSLLVRGDELDPSKTALVLGGGLMQNDVYRSKILERHQESLGAFAHVKVVARPALRGAEQLLYGISADD